GWLDGGGGEGPGRVGAPFGRSGGDTRRSRGEVQARGRRGVSGLRGRQPEALRRAAAASSHSRVQPASVPWGVCRSPPAGGRRGGGGFLGPPPPPLRVEGGADPKTPEIQAHLC